MSEFNRCLCVTLLACLLAAPLFSQIPTFQKAYAGGANDDGMWGIEITDGFLLAGRGRPIVGNADGLLIRTDRYGEIVWQKNFGTTRREFFRYATAGTDGSFWAYGATDDLSSGIVDAWVVNVDSSGNLLWQKTFGDSIEVEQPNAPAVAVPGGCIVSGTRKLPSSSSILGSFIARLDQNGEATWSRYLRADNSVDSTLTLNLSVQLATDSVLYAVSRVGGNVGLVAIDPANGHILRAIEFSHTDYALDCFGIRPTADGNLALMGFGNHPPGVNLPRPMWLAKIRPDGQVIWCKSYNSAYAWTANAGIMQFNTLADGGFILCPSEIVPPLPYEWRMLMKIDAHGETVWKKSFSFQNGVPEFLYQCFGTSDGGLAAIGTSRPSLQNALNDIILMKTYANGEIEGCCAKKRGVLPALDFFITSTPVSYIEAPYLSPVSVNLTSTQVFTRTATDMCSGYIQTTLYDTLRFCPGETVTVGDSTYSQPGTASLAIPSLTGGCDTLVEYTLEYEPLNPTSTLALDCPASITLPDAGPAIVFYNEPDAFSDCNCPKVSIVRQSGNASGAVFPPGVSTVCYRADDACGQSKTCCFTVTLSTDEEACDEKKAGCVNFELLRINRDVEQRWVYYIRATNDCPDPVSFLYFQVPDGLKAVAPLHNNTYNAPGGHPYRVFNPNYSPFYSIRFKPLNTALAGGQSDVFRYVLPPQADVEYIHAGARLASGVLAETHLNTFGCAVGSEVLPKPDVRARGAYALAPEALLYPNPWSSEGALSLTGAAWSGTTFVLRDVTGRVIFETTVPDDGVLIQNHHLSNGVYFFSLTQNGQPAGRGKLTVLK